MSEKMKNIFLNERLILYIIVVNTIFMFINGFFPNNLFLESVDTLFTLFFLCEALVKIGDKTWHGYWECRWNRLDFLILIIALPSIVDPFINFTISTNTLLALRALRVFKSLRLFKFIPNISRILKGIQMAMKSSLLICLAYLIFLLVFSIMTSSLFGEYAPQYFGNPLLSMYNVFRLFTIEGWYDMPDAVVATGGPIMGIFTRLYFAVLLFAGGIIGMSIINSIFVDAMVSDNNDDVLSKLENIERQLQEMNKKNSPSKTEEE